MNQFRYSCDAHPLKSLLHGHKAFFTQYFEQYPSLYNDLQKGQSPMAMIVGCVDSRADPAIIFQVKPGDIFTVRNVANMVPPYQPTEGSYHGVSAALEFGVNNLNIPHIVILGHSQCAGIRALLEGAPQEKNGYSFVEEWMKIARAAKEKVLREYADRPIEEQARRCEEESIKISLENLKTFPWIRKKIDSGQLIIEGWHLDIASGSLRIYDETTQRFCPTETCLETAG